MGQDLILQPLRFAKSVAISRASAGDGQLWISISVFVLLMTP